MTSCIWVNNLITMNIQINWVMLRNIKSTQKCRVMSIEEHTRGFWPSIPICSCCCLYSFSLSCANLSRSKMWYLPHSHDNLVMNNLVNKCFQQRKVLLIAFCVLSNPSNINKTKDLSFLKPVMTILSRSPVFHKIQTRKKNLAYLVKLSQLFFCYFS